MSKYLKILIGVSAIMLSAFKCSQAQEAYLTVQVCLVGANGPEEFLNIMRRVASSEGLQFVDYSAGTKEALNATRNENLVKLNHVPTINVGIEGKGGLGVTAGNLGLPSDQVALGFTAGANEAKARRLSDTLVKALSQHWQVKKIARGKGVFPMNACKSE